MTSAERHLSKYPNARPSTLAMIEAKRRKTEQLRQELEAVNTFRDSIGYVRKPSESETLLRRSIRAFSEFVTQLGGR